MDYSTLLITRVGFLCGVIAVVSAVCLIAGFIVYLDEDISEKEDMKKRFIKVMNVFIKVFLSSLILRILIP